MATQTYRVNTGAAIFKSFEADCVETACAYVRATQVPNYADARWFEVKQGGRWMKIEGKTVMLDFVTADNAEAPHVEVYDTDTQETVLTIPITSRVTVQLAELLAQTLIDNS